MTDPSECKAMAMVFSFPICLEGLVLHGFYLGRILRGSLNIILLIFSPISLIGWFFIAPGHGLLLILEMLCVIAGTGGYGRDQHCRPLV